MSGSPTGYHCTMTPFTVIAGLDPAIQQAFATARSFPHLLDRRVKPGDDD